MRIVEFNMQTCQRIERDMTQDEIAALPPPPSVEQVRARALLELRAERAAVLNALAGIGFDALEAGDSATASAVADAREALKNITSWPAFVAATTYEEMKAAVMDRYKQIAAGVPAPVRTAFVEVASR